MFLITLNKVKNLEVLKSVYVGLHEYKLGTQTFLVYVPDIEARSYNIKNLICSAIKFNVRDFQGMDEFEITDIMYDMVERDMPVVFDYSKCTKKLTSLIKSCLDEVGLEVKTYGKTNLSVPDLGCLTRNDLSIVAEFFKVDMKTPYYTAKDFLLRYVVNDKGDVINELTNEKLGNVLKTHIVEILFTLPPNFAQLNERSSRVFDGSAISGKWFEPWLFLHYDEGICEKIYDYKMAMFEKIKNIEPEQYESLPPELVDILNRNEYIQFKDIIKIISGEDEFVKLSK